MKVNTNIKAGQDELSALNGNANLVLVLQSAEAHASGNIVGGHNTAIAANFSNVEIGNSRV